MHGFPAVGREKRGALLGSEFERRARVCELFPKVLPHQTEETRRNKIEDPGLEARCRGEVPRKRSNGFSHEVDEKTFRHNERSCGPAAKAFE
jgi:hypothetical protein